MNCEMEIKKVMKKIGITPELNGYHYLEKCIIEVKKCFEEGKTPCSFYQMYKDVAKLFDVTPKSVERCMRHAKIVAETLRTDEFTYIFCNLRNIPLSAFISIIAEYILIENS